MSLRCAVAALLLSRCAASASAEPRADASASPSEVKLDVRGFQVVERDSGPISYYQVIEEEGVWMVRARYRPPLETVTLGMEMPEKLRSQIKRLRWRWRVLVFPNGADECRPGKSDSAAAVFVTFKRGLKYYIIKYAWSSETPKGAVCNKKRNLFLVRDTVILESNGTVNTWIAEEIDPRAEFVRHFGGSLDEVPDLVGIGIFTDGDQTRSRSEADYADFSAVI